MPKHLDKVYYVLVGINKHHHYKDCKSKLDEEGIPITEAKMLDMVKDLPEGEPIDEPLEPQDYPDKRDLPPDY